jgi:hypothetical protein
MVWSSNYRESVIATDAANNELPLNSRSRRFIPGLVGSVLVAEFFGIVSLL